MITYNFKGPLIFQLTVAKLLSLLPYEWDRRSQKLTFTKRKWVLRKIKVVMVGMAIYTGVQLGMISLSKFSLEKKLLGLAFSCVIFAATVYLFNWNHDPIHMTLINSLLDFENKDLKGVMYKRTLADKGSYLTARLVYGTAMSLTPCVAFVLAAFPCAPPFLASMTPWCQDGGRPPKLMETVFLVSEIFVWIHAPLTSVFYVTMVLMLTISCLSSYLTIISQRTSGFTKSAYEIYRKMQILDILNTVSNSSRHLLMFFAGAPGVQVITSFVCIRLHAQVHMPEFLVFPLLMFDTSEAVMVFLTLAAQVHDKSSKLLETWKRDADKKLKKRLIRAMRPIRIRFGQNNFVDQGTPLVVEDLAINQTVSLLLLSSKNG